MFYYPSKGKVFTTKEPTTPPLYALAISLGKGDSIENYIEVDITERDAYYAELERQQQEEELRRLLMELYPAEQSE